MKIIFLGSVCPCFSIINLSLNFQVIQETGVSALAVHGRTKDERPNNDVHLDYIQEVAKVRIYLSDLKSHIDYPCFVLKLNDNYNP